MRTVLAFVNRRNLRHAHSTQIVAKVYRSHWGSAFYGRSHFDSRVTLSEKKMNERGFYIETITRDEFQRLQALEVKRAARLQAAADRQELAARAAAVEACLKSDPIAVRPNDGGNPFVARVADLAGTPMIDAYHGCGKGTAYLIGDRLIAYHYGHRQPDNAPTGPNIQAVRCELSCTQVCL